MINPCSFVKGRLPNWLVLVLTSIDVNWKHTVGMIETNPIAKLEFLNSSILSKKNNATPNNWIKVMTWEASWASEKNEESIKQKLKTAIMSKK